MAIVGGGLAGLTAAIELVRAGRTVAVLEAERIGWGASGRNGGFVGPGYATSLSHIALMAGREAAKELYRLSIEGVRIVEENLAALGMADNVATYGKLSVMRYADVPALKARQEQMARDFGYGLEFRDREQVRGMLRSTKYHEALFDPRAFHFHPLNYALGLAAGIEALGGAGLRRLARHRIGPRWRNQAAAHRQVGGFRRGTWCSRPAATPAT